MGRLIKWTPIEKDVLSELYLVQELSAQKIAKMVGAKVYQIDYLLDKYEIPRRTLSVANRKYSVNHSYFKQIDDCEKAYWLGFLYADGFVTAGNYVGLSLAVTDKKHVEKFREAIRSTHPIHIYKTNGYANTEYARLAFASQEMTRDLENLGCFQHKTLLLKFPTEQQVPHQFLKDFVRGYIDGDGSITTGGENSPLRLRVCGTRELLEGLKIYFNTILAPDSISNKLEKRHKDTKNNYALSLGSARKSLLILHELYDGASVFLDRKNDLYLLKKAQLQSSLPEMVGV